MDESNETSAGRSSGPRPDPRVVFDASLVITRRNLPHWFLPGSTYFLTYRLADSIPRAVIHRWKEELAEWDMRRAWPLCPADVKRREAFMRWRIESYLDGGRGECVLAEPRVADVVEESLRHFDGTRYILGDWVIMPNHVHVLVTPRTHTLKQVLHTWRSYSAHEINKRLGRTGELWQEEPYDHIVRHGTELGHFERYIARNPAKARLKRGFRVGRAAGPSMDCTDEKVGEE